MRKLIPLLILLLLLPICAFAAAADLTLVPQELGFTYTLEAEGNTFVVLIWEGESESGRQTLYSENGHFEGHVDLPYTGKGGKMTVTVQNLKVVKVIPEHNVLMIKGSIPGSKGSIVMIEK